MRIFLQLHKRVLFRAQHLPHRSLDAAKSIRTIVLLYISLGNLFFTLYCQSALNGSIWVFLCPIRTAIKQQQQLHEPNVNIKWKIASRSSICTRCEWLICVGGDAFVVGKHMLYQPLSPGKVVSCAFDCSLLAAECSSV